MIDVKAIKPSICVAKQYDVLLWKPSLGTGIINKFENNQAYEVYGSVVDIARMKTDLDLLGHIHKGRVSVTTKERPFVIIGTCGEMWIVDIEAVIDKYIPKCNLAYSKDISKMDAGDMVTLTVSSNSNRYYCRKIDRKYRGTIKTKYGDLLEYNSIEDGTDGDYILSRMNDDGTENDNDMWVVNCNVFRKTYGILDC